MFQVRLNNVSFRYTDQYYSPLKNINFTAKSNQWWVIQGPSGAGKTTFLKLLSGLLKPCQGTLLLNERIIMHQGIATIISPEISFLMQEYIMIPHLTIQENLTLRLRYANYNSNLIVPRALNMLSKVGLEDYAAKLPEQLSGGQRQRAALARELITSPKCFIADEPFSALDLNTARKMVQMLQNIKNETAMTIIMVVHDMTPLQSVDYQHYVL